MKRGALQHHHRMTFAFIALLVVIIIILTVRLFLPEEQKEDNTVILPSSDPVEWIQSEGEQQMINVPEATQFQGDLRGGHQRYFERDGSMSIIYYHAAYLGIYFSTIFEVGDQQLFRITNQQNPHDGIPEFFAVFRREEGRPQLFLFVDDDWKRLAASRLFIVWGEDLRNKDILHIKEFDFSNQQNGIYIDKIDKDLDWITSQNPIVGGVFVSAFDMDGIYDESIINGTYVMVR
ncbi:MAG: hypothetical protein ABIH34_04885 [Nanoarchaeota archaeon]